MNAKFPGTSLCRTIACSRVSLVMAALCWSQLAYSQSLSGRFSTSLYTWERHPSATLSETHARLYQTAQLTFGRLAQNRLSFHVYGLLTQDIAQSAQDDPIPRLYQSYVQWRERKGWLQRIRLGRQRVYSGVAYGTIDGVDVQVRIAKIARIKGFAGILVPFSNQIEVGTWDDRHAFGLSVQTNRLANTDIQLSFVQRNRTPVAYAAPGRYTGRLLTFESLEQRLVGLDLRRRLGRELNVYGRLDYDLAQERVRRAQVELRVSPGTKWSISGEFIHRAPLIEANSIFSVFEQHTTQIVGLRGTYRLTQTTSVNANFGLQKYQGDESLRFGVGLRFRYGSFGYNFQRGYAGENNGVYAAVNYPLRRDLGLVATTGVARYALFDESLDTHTSLTGSIGLNYRPNRQVSFDVLGQGIRNRFSSQDFRLFVKANYWFFKR